MPKKNTLSFSKLNMLWRCGQQYYFRYVLGKKIPPGVALIRGIAAHDIIEANLKSKVAGEGLFTAEKIKDMAKDSFIKQWEKMPVKLTEKERTEGLKATKGKVLDQTVDSSVFHGEAYAPLIFPKEVETFFRIDCPGYPYDITGRIDILEDGRIRDTKVTGRSQPKDSADRSDQLTCYSMFKYVEEKKIYRVKFDYVVVTDAGAHKPCDKNKNVIHHESPRTLEHFDAFKRKFENACLFLEKGTFLPTNRDNWWCCDDYCGFFEICPYVCARKVFAT